MVAVLIAVLVAYLVGVATPIVVSARRRRKAQDQLEMAERIARGEGPHDKHDKHDDYDGSSRLSSAGMIYMGGIGTH